MMFLKTFRFPVFLFLAIIDLVTTACTLSCLHGGICVVHEGREACTCPPPYEGQLCAQVESPPVFQSAFCGSTKNYYLPHPSTFSTSLGLLESTTVRITTPLAYDEGDAVEIPVFRIDYRNDSLGEDIWVQEPSFVANYSSPTSNTVVFRASDSANRTAYCMIKVVVQSCPMHTCGEGSFILRLCGGESPGECLPCPTVSCSKCNPHPPYRCTQCIDGYYLNTTLDVCVPCSATPPDDDSYMAQNCTRYSDAVYQPCQKTCPNNSFVLSMCTENHNLQCSGTFHPFFDGSILDVDNAITDLYLSCASEEQNSTSSNCIVCDEDSRLHRSFGCVHYAAQQCVEGYYPSISSWKVVTTEGSTVPNADGCAPCLDPCQTCTNSSFCLKCAEGYYLAAATPGHCHPCTITTSCPVGYALTRECSATNDGECTPCGYGCHTCSPAAPTECEVCMPGYYYWEGNQDASLTLPGDGAGECLPCATACPSSDQYIAAACTPTQDAICQNCSTCGVGEYVVAGSCTGQTDRQCQPCAQGCASCDAVTGACLQCKVGLAFVEYAQDVCGLCPDGFFAENSECVPCTDPSLCNEAGHFLISPCLPFADAVCSQCSVGFFYNQSDSLCQPCRTCSLADNVYTLKNCTATDNAVCEQCGVCPEGTFPQQPCSPTTNTVCQPCQRCRPGFAVLENCSSTAVGGNTLCTICPPGTFSQDGRACEPCPRNFYASGPGAATCKPCPLHSSANIASAQCECEEGYYYYDLHAFAHHPYCRPCLGPSMCPKGATSLLCLQGYYLTRCNTSCQSCPEGGLCGGQTALPLPQPGFARTLPLDIPPPFLLFRNNNAFLGNNFTLPKCHDCRFVFEPLFVSVKASLKTFACNETAVAGKMVQCTVQSLTRENEPTIFPIEWILYASIGAEPDQGQEKHKIYALAASGGLWHFEFIPTFGHTITLILGNNITNTESGVTTIPLTAEPIPSAFSRLCSFAPLNNLSALFLDPIPNTTLISPPPTTLDICMYDRFQNPIPSTTQLAVSEQAVWFEPNIAVFETNNSASRKEHIAQRWKKDGKDSLAFQNFPPGLYVFNVNMIVNLTQYQEELGSTAWTATSLLHEDSVFSLDTRNLFGNRNNQTHFFEDNDAILKQNGALNSSFDLLKNRVMPKKDFFLRNDTICTQEYTYQQPNTSTINATGDWQWPHSLARSGKISDIFALPLVNGTAVFAVAAVCEPGFYPVTLTGPCAPCPPNTYDSRTLADMTSGVGAWRCQTTFLSNSSVMILASSSAASIYEQFEGCVPWTCTKCPHGRITLNISSVSEETCVCNEGTQADGWGGCAICHPNVQCQPGLPPRTLPGHYLLYDHSSVYRCEPVESCLENNTCAEGYAGEKCAWCEDGYMRLKGFCRKCTPAARLLYCAIHFGVPFFIMGLARFATSSFDNGITLTIIHLAQFFGVLATMPAFWSGNSGAYLQWLGLFNFDISINMLMCFHDFDYYTLWKVKLFLPLITVGLFFLSFLAELGWRWTKEKWALWNLRQALKITIDNQQDVPNWNMNTQMAPRSSTRKPNGSFRIKRSAQIRPMKSQNMGIPKSKSRDDLSARSQSSHLSTQTRSVNDLSQNPVDEFFSSKSLSNKSEYSGNNAQIQEENNAKKQLKKGLKAETAYRNQKGKKFDKAERLTPLFRPQSGKTPKTLRGNMPLLTTNSQSRFSSSNTSTPTQNLNTNSSYYSNHSTPLSQKKLLTTVRRKKSSLLVAQSPFPPAPASGWQESRNIFHFCEHTQCAHDSESVRQNWRISTKTIFYRLFNVLTMFLLVEHFPVTITALQIFNCRTLPDGTAALVLAPQKECYTQAWQETMPYAVGLLLLFSFLFPFLLWTAFITFKANNQLKAPFVRLSLRGLYGHYRPEYSGYWLFQLAEKILFGVAFLFIQSVQLQICLSLFTLWICTECLQYFRPYTRLALHRLQLLGLTGTALLLLCAWAAEALRTDGSSLAPLNTAIVGVMALFCAAVIATLAAELYRLFLLGKFSKRTSVGRKQLSKLQLLAHYATSSEKQLQKRLYFYAEFYKRCHYSWPGKELTFRKEWVDTNNIKQFCDQGEFWVCCYCNLTAMWEIGDHVASQTLRKINDQIKIVQLKTKALYEFDDPLRGVWVFTFETAVSGAEFIFWLQRALLMETQYPATLKYVRKLPAPPQYFSPREKEFCGLSMSFIMMHPETLIRMEKKATVSECTNNSEYFASHQDNNNLMKMYNNSPISESMQTPTIAQPHNNSKAHFTLTGKECVASSFYCGTQISKIIGVLPLLFINTIITLRRYMKDGDIIFDMQSCAAIEDFQSSRKERLEMTVGREEPCTPSGYSFCTPHGDSSREHGYLHSGGTSRRRHSLHSALSTGSVNLPLNSAQNSLEYFLQPISPSSFEYYLVDTNGSENHIFDTSSFNSASSFSMCSSDILASRPHSSSTLFNSNDQNSNSNENNSTWSLERNTSYQWSASKKPAKAFKNDIIRKKIEFYCLSPFHVCSILAPENSTSAAFSKENANTVEKSKREFHVSTITNTPENCGGKPDKIAPHIPPSKGSIAAKPSFRLNLQVEKPPKNTFAPSEILRNRMIETIENNSVNMVSVAEPSPYSRSSGSIEDCHSSSSSESILAEEEMSTTRTFSCQNSLESRNPLLHTPSSELKNFSIMSAEELMYGPESSKQANNLNIISNYAKQVLKAHYNNLKRRALKHRNEKEVLSKHGASLGTQPFGVSCGSTSKMSSVKKSASISHQTHYCRDSPHVVIQANNLEAEKNEIQFENSQENCLTKLSASSQQEKTAAIHTSGSPSTHNSQSHFKPALSCALPFVLLNSKPIFNPLLLNNAQNQPQDVPVKRSNAAVMRQKLHERKVFFQSLITTQDRIKGIMHMKYFPVGFLLSTAIVFLVCVFFTAISIAEANAVENDTMFYEVFPVIILLLMLLIWKTPAVQRPLHLQSLYILYCVGFVLRLFLFGFTVFGSSLEEIQGNKLLLFFTVGLFSFVQDMVLTEMDFSISSFLLVLFQMVFGTLFIVVQSQRYHDSNQTQSNINAEYVSFVFSVAIVAAVGVFALFSSRWRVLNYRELLFATSHHLSHKETTLTLLRNFLPPFYMSDFSAFDVKRLLHNGPKGVLPHSERYPGVAVLTLKITNADALMKYYGSQTAVQIISTLFKAFDTEASKYLFLKVHQYSDYSVVCAGLPFSTPLCAPALLALAHRCFKVAQRENKLLMDHEATTGNAWFILHGNIVLPALRAGVQMGTVTAGYIGQKYVKFTVYGKPVEESYHLMEAAEENTIAVSNLIANKVEAYYRQSMNNLPKLYGKYWEKDAELDVGPFTFISNGLFNEHLQTAGNERNEQEDSLCNLLYFAVELNVENEEITNNELAQILRTYYAFCHEHDSFDRRKSQRVKENKWQQINWEKEGLGRMFLIPNYEDIYPPQEHISQCKELFAPLPTLSHFADSSSFAGRANRTTGLSWIQPQATSIPSLNPLTKGLQRLLARCPNLTAVFSSQLYPSSTIPFNISLGVVGMCLLLTVFLQCIMLAYKELSIIYSPGFVLLIATFLLQMVFLLLIFYWKLQHKWLRERNNFSIGKPNYVAHNNNLFSFFTYLFFPNSSQQPLEKEQEIETEYTEWREKADKCLEKEAQVYRNTYPPPSCRQKEAEALCYKYLKMSVVLALFDLYLSRIISDLCFDFNTLRFEHYPTQVIILLLPFLVATHLPIYPHTLVPFIILDSALATMHYFSLNLWFFHQSHVPETTSSYTKLTMIAQHLVFTPFAVCLLYHMQTNLRHTALISHHISMAGFWNGFAHTLLRQKVFLQDAAIEQIFQFQKNRFLPSLSAQCKCAVVETNTHSVVLVARIRNFSTSLTHIRPAVAFAYLSVLFEVFDSIVISHGKTKVPSQGAEYQVISVSEPSYCGCNQHTVRMLSVAFEMLKAFSQIHAEFGQLLRSFPRLELTIGLAEGPTVGFVPDITSPAFKIIGPTLILAQALLHTGLGGVVHTTENVKRTVKDAIQCCVVECVAPPIFVSSSYYIGDVGSFPILKEYVMSQIQDEDNSPPASITSLPSTSAVLPPIQRGGRREAPKPSTVDNVPGKTDTPTPVALPSTPSHRAAPLQLSCSSPPSSSHRYNLSSLPHHHTKHDSPNSQHLYQQSKKCHVSMNEIISPLSLQAANSDEKTISPAPHPTSTALTVSQANTSTPAINSSKSYVLPHLLYDTVLPLFSPSPSPSPRFYHPPSPVLFQPSASHSNYSVQKVQKKAVTSSLSSPQISQALQATPLSKKKLRQQSFRIRTFPTPQPSACDSLATSCKGVKSCASVPDFGGYSSLVPQSNSETTIARQLTQRSASSFHADKRHSRPRSLSFSQLAKKKHTPTAHCINEPLVVCGSQKNPKVSLVHSNDMVRAHTQLQEHALSTISIADLSEVGTMAAFPSFPSSCSDKGTPPLQSHITNAEAVSLQLAQSSQCALPHTEEGKFSSAQQPLRTIVSTEEVSSQRSGHSDHPLQWSGLGGVVVDSALQAEVAPSPYSPNTFPSEIRHLLPNQPNTVLSSPVLLPRNANSFSERTPPSLKYHPPLLTPSSTPPSPSPPHSLPSHTPPQTPQTNPLLSPKSNLSEFPKKKP